MRAVLMEQGRLWVDDIATPSPESGEVLVKTAACGICGSDLHAAQHTAQFIATSRETGGAFKLTTEDPVVLGHEFSAELVDYGVDTERKIPVGSLVCSVPMLARNTPLAVGYSDEVPGGFAEYMLLSESMLMQVPDGTPAASAALTEPMAVGLHAVNKANLSGEEAIIVLGCGPVGLAVTTALKARDAGPIVAADFSPGRRGWAQQQGAHIAVDPRETDPFSLSDTRGRPLVVFECVGVPGMLDDVFVKAPANTRVVVVGVCLEQDHIRPLVAINKELSLQFVLGYTMREFRDSLFAIADGSFDVADLISHQISLQEVADTFEALKRPDDFGKVVVVPSKA